MKWRKAAAVALAGAMTVSLAACSSGGEEKKRGNEKR